MLAFVRVLRVLLFYLEGLHPPPVLLVAGVVQLRRVQPERLLLLYLRHEEPHLPLLPQAVGCSCSASSDN